MVKSRFESFVVFAGMRTGSNLLEANLNAMSGVQCHGEAFNPHFLGYPSNAPILGIDQDTRDNDPLVLLAAIRQGGNGLHGFRYFHDHDPRVFDALIDDAACAKVILTRNPVESYVSWKIAQETGQWKLTDVKARKDGQAYFDPEEFATHLEQIQTFQTTLRRRLQVLGQTAYHISYEDLQDIDVLNGLARYLGASTPLERPDGSLKRQNPSSVLEKVRNPDEMERSLAQMDRFDLSRTPDFEPQRGPNVPSYIVAAKSALVYLPVRGGPRRSIMAWLAAVDQVSEDALITKLTQKDLRQWQRKHPGHRSFTVLRHPVARAHAAFCQHILPVGPGSYVKLRQTLIRRYGLTLPVDGPESGYTLDLHRLAFKDFLRFLKSNLAGQTSIRVDAAWCTQAQIISGFGTLCLPDRILREADLMRDLPLLAQTIGADRSPRPMLEEETLFSLAEVYDAEIEHLARGAYQKDYLMFGFGDWTPVQPD